MSSRRIRSSIARKSRVGFTLAIAIFSSAAASSVAATPPAVYAQEATSAAVAATGFGDNDGYHVLVSKDGLEPVELALLWEPGSDGLAWIGSTCLTGDESTVAVVYGPASFDNDPVLRDRGAFLALVDVDTATVIRSNERVSLKYHTLGCGRGSDLVVSRNLGEEQQQTELLSIDVHTGGVISASTVGQQVTSAVPTANGVVGVAGNDLVTIQPDGNLTAPIEVAGPATQLRPNEAGGVDFISVEGDRSVVRSTSTQGAVALASGEVGTIGLFQGSEQNIVAGAVDQVDSTNALEVVQSESPPDAVSTAGDVQLSIDQDPDGSTTVNAVGAQPPDDAETNELRVAPSVAPSIATSTNTTAPRCAIGRNESKGQVMQPSTAQVEWAVDLAVKGKLNIVRPANFQNHGLPPYRPQRLIPPVPLDGGGTIPAQVLLGVLTQESNLKQASWHATRGNAGNPLIADFYGGAGTTGVNFDNAECGYGIGQITDGMRVGDNLWTDQQRKAIAYDYATNIAAAARILAQKWNQLKAMGTIAQNADSTDADAWTFAIWAYNTGIHPKTSDPKAPYGVGWTNNPMNPDYKPDRKPFLMTTYDDARHPSDWPYQEKVLGFASNSLYEGGKATFLPLTWWTDKPRNDQFCSVDENSCDPDDTTLHSNGVWSHCIPNDNRCWWHSPAVWGNFATSPNEQIRYSPDAPEPAAPPKYEAACSAKFAGRTAIVDNLDRSTNLMGCPETANTGTFKFSYGDGSTPAVAAEVDQHQFGGGYLGNFYFSHTGSGKNAAAKLTGTWTPPSGTTGWRRIWVHVPAVGAESPQATYTIRTSIRATPIERVVNQRWTTNKWVDLGTFYLLGRASVSLSNVTPTDWDFGRSVDVAWDAVAFESVPQPVKTYVAFGDSYQSGEGNEPYEPPSDIGGRTPDLTNSCHRSSKAYPALIAAAAKPSQFFFLACSGAALRHLNGDKYDRDNTMHTEMPQLAAGYLNKDVTAVTVGIGGNDLRFADVVKSCATTLLDCTRDGYKFDPDMDLTLDEFADATLKDLRNVLPDFYRDIKARVSPSAKIVVVGYPTLFDTSRPRGGCWGLTYNEQQYINLMASRLTVVLRDSAKEAGVLFYDPDRRYKESDRVCSVNEKINGVISRSSSGSSPWNGPLHGYYDVVGRGSFHPKAAGHQLIADDIRRMLGL